jgi:AcrR family transcriptional regulator
MSTRVPKSRLSAQKRRDLIVEAALAEFAARGYEAASMGRIATAAGISRTVLYDHFPSKRALFAVLLGDQHVRLLEHLQTAMVADAPSQARIRATVDAFFEFAETEPLAWRLLFPDHPPHDADVAADHRHCRSESNRLLARMLQPDAVQAGIDPGSRLGAAVFAINQEALHGAVRWWQAHPRVDRDELVQAAMVALWHGLGGSARPGV